MNCDTVEMSIVIPVYNEQDNVNSLVCSLRDVLDKYKSYEIIFVNDGSKDDTLNVLKDVCKKINNVFYISLSRNFGHQNALRAGIEKTSGKVVISMDGDHQHPPYIIDEMMNKWNEGYDIVSTIRDDSCNVSLFKRHTSSMFYKILSKISDVNLKNGSADFRLFDRKVVDVLVRFQERSIFYRGVFTWLGFKQFELTYIPEKRMSGGSKYTLRKMVGLAVDGISSFSFFPLRLAALVGISIAFVSFIYVIYAFYVKNFTNHAVSGWFSIMAGIYFLGGIQLLFLGMCGEYIGRIYMEVKGRPNYIIADSNIK